MWRDVGNAIETTSQFAWDVIWATEQGVYDWWREFSHDAVALYNYLSHGQAVRLRRIFEVSHPVPEMNHPQTILNLLDFFTYGGVSASERDFQQAENIYDYINWGLGGIPNMVGGALFPERPFSVEHLMNMTGTASLVVGGASVYRGAVGTPNSFRPQGNVNVVQGPGGHGQIIGNLNGLTQAERLAVNDLVRQGRTVEILRPDGIPGVGTPDFRINGILTELKTIHGTSPNTPVTRIRQGFDQGAQTVILDARGTWMTAADANTTIARVDGVFNGNIPGRIEIWTDQGVILGGQ
jgi:hypothetical protein